MARSRPPAPAPAPMPAPPDPDGALGAPGSSEGLAVVLRARDMTVTFPSRSGAVQAVRGISLTIRRGEIVGVVGESGCGKSTLALALQDLLRPPAEVAGEVRLAGDVSLYALPRGRRVALHGEKVGMVFQASQSSMNPVLPIAVQAAHIARSHGLAPSTGVARLRDLAGRVGLDPERTLAAYPHQLSGGQRQRTSLCLALVLDPPLVVLDEPTTALDVLTQEEVLDTLREVRRDLGTAFLFITHDIGVVASLADRLAVLYAGSIVEEGYAQDLLRHPQHPYTRALVTSMPRLDRSHLGTPIPGSPPDLSRLGPGCAFAPRCPLREDLCETGSPRLLPVAAGSAPASAPGVFFSYAHRAACFVAQRAANPSESAQDQDVIS